MNDRTLIFVIATLFIASSFAAEFCISKPGVDIIHSPTEPVILKTAEMGDRVVLLDKIQHNNWVKVKALSSLMNDTVGFVRSDDIALCPEEPLWFCNHQVIDLMKEALDEGDVEYQSVDKGSKFIVIAEEGEFLKVQGVVGYVAGHVGYVKKGELEVCDDAMETTTGFNRNAAVAYAEKWWSSANHKCGKYSSCTPYSYWGGEVCGYASQGGDCANFVSQSLIAGGHPKLVGGGDICRGYPCGVEEIGATKLGLCLSQKFGWKRVCGYRQAPPAGLKVGDVIVYHAGSCGSYNAHATIVTKISGGVPYISCHSNKQHNAHYTYLQNSKPYYEYLMRG